MWKNDLINFIIKASYFKTIFLCSLLKISVCTVCVIEKSIHSASASGLKGSEVLPAKERLRVLAEGP